MMPCKICGMMIVYAISPHDHIVRRAFELKTKGEYLVVGRFFHKVESGIGTHTRHSELCAMKSMVKKREAPMIDDRLKRIEIHRRGRHQKGK